MSAQREPLAEPEWTKSSSLDAVDIGKPGAPGAPLQASTEAKPRWKMTIKLLAFVVIGAIAGFGYHKLVGCRTGTCPITANPYISTAYGAVMGFLISGGFK
jgi:uncharacterized protein DUF6132